MRCGVLVLKSNDNDDLTALQETRILNLIYIFIHGLQVLVLGLHQIWACGVQMFDNTCVTTRILFGAGAAHCSSSLCIRPCVRTHSRATTMLVFFKLRMMVHRWGNSPCNAVLGF